MRLAVEFPVGFDGDGRLAVDGPGGPLLVTVPPEEIDELVLVHPPDRCAGSGSHPVPHPARTVTMCSSAVAAVRELSCRVDLPPGPLAVLELRPSGVGATVLAGPDGPVLAARRAPGGSGCRVTATRLLADVTAEAGQSPPTLTGGVLLVSERTDDPEPAARLAELCGEPPWLLGPDATVLGALRPAPAHRPIVLPTRTTPGGVAGAAALGTGLLPPPAAHGAGLPPAPAALGTGLLPPPAARHPARTATTLTAAGIMLAGLLTGLLTGRATTPAPARTEPGVLVQYDYALRLPAGWRHSGGLPERRRTLLTPTAAPEGSDLIAVEQTPLGYDSGAEPDRAHRELVERFRLAAEADPALLGPARPVDFGGRPSTTYRQVRQGTTIDWYVLFDRDAQLSVGCQYVGSRTTAVAAACAEVVATLGRRDSP